MSDNIEDVHPLFNFTEFAKQVREEVKELERQYKIKRGEPEDDNPEPDR